MIAWKYINKNSAAIAAMRDYKNMRFILCNTPDEFKEIHHRMFAPGTAKLTGLPSMHDALAGSEKLPSQIDRLDAMRERYVAAVEYIAWFEPAWLELDDTERHILTEFYIIMNMNSGATYRLMHEYSYGERKIEKMRSDALKHLRVLLFG